MDPDLIPYFEKYVLEELNAEDTAAFEKRLASDRTFRAAYHAYTRQLQQDLPPRATTPANRAQAWQTVTEQIDLSVPAARRHRRLHLAWKAAAAACVVFLIGLFMFRNINSRSDGEVEVITKTTGAGQKYTITLADGTTIRLNAESRISYPKSFSDSSRTVTLQGEAYFDVTPDKNRPFTIQSGDLQTTVLGTSFNIKAFPAEEVHDISVKTGTVQITIANQAGEKIILKRGDRVRYRTTEHAWHVDTIAPENIAYWTQGYLYFHDESLADVLHVLSRWYGVEFEVKDPEVLQCRITLKQKDENIKNILDIIKYATDIDYQFNHNKIIIKGRAC